MKVKEIIAGFLSWKILILLFAVIGVNLLPMNNLYSAISYETTLKFKQPMPYLVWVWANFDGMHYLNIAKYGYNLFLIPFMPLYPITFHALSLLPNLSHLVSAQIVSNLAFFLSLIVIYRLLKIDGKLKLSTLFLLVLITFPTSLFYGAVYNDSFYLLLSSLCILLARQKHWFFASLLGALATLTRINGLALFIYLIFEYFESDQKNVLSTYKLSFSRYLKIFQKHWMKFSFFLIVPLAFAGYLFYVDRNFNSYQALLVQFGAWHQEKIVFPLVTFWRYFKIFVLMTNRASVVYWVAVWEFLAVIFYISLLVYSFKKIRLSYWVFIATSLLIPAASGTFQGMPRYALHLYPLFLALTLWLNQKQIIYKTVYFTISIILLFLAVILFTRGYFIA